MIEGRLLLPVVLWDFREDINVWAVPDTVLLWFTSRLDRALSFSDISSVEPALTASWLCVAVSAPLFPCGVWRSPKCFLLVQSDSHFVPWNVGAQTTVSFAGIKLLSCFSCFCLGDKNAIFILRVEHRSKIFSVLSTSHLRLVYNCLGCKRGSLCNSAIFCPPADAIQNSHG